LRRRRIERWDGAIIVAMSKWDEDDEGEYTGEEEQESLEDADIDDDASAETLNCPGCGKLIYEQAERCPHCGHYVTEETAPRRRRVKWFVVAVVICLIIVLLWQW